ncbi:hypothetical protein [Streptomyces violarus]|uniref:Uncharacterized protein n=1 Tax=Streptomyces violarus TaxID=67380 RepID=A0A7W4ZN67_9ACTN|nr:MULTISPECIES: hypothetical protein [Streptomyces]MBB3075575.1 hypothetical protein [Streptomyces violarus]WRT98168.1 hypothetical protein VJ737_10940 [Streptomyces sp. CGMCC 4.1772]
MKYADSLRVVEDLSAAADPLLWSNVANFPVLVYGQPEGVERTGWWLFWRDPSTHEKQSRYMPGSKSERVIAEQMARQYLDEMFGG